MLNIIPPLIQDWLPRFVGNMQRHQSVIASIRVGSRTHPHRTMWNNWWSFESVSWWLGALQWTSMRFQRVCSSTKFGGPGSGTIQNTSPGQKGKHQRVVHPWIWWWLFDCGGKYRDSTGHFAPLAPWVCHGDDNVSNVVPSCSHAAPISADEATSSTRSQGRLCGRAGGEANGR